MIVLMLLYNIKTFVDHQEREKRNMRQLLIPQRLRPGDRVATVSLSWGGAGDEGLRWRYDQGVKRLRDEFGLTLIEMETTLKGSDYVYRHPEKRAEDLMNAFRDPDIKGIFSVIGGDDSIRILPYIDFDVIPNNPKILLGYSDTTVSHFICLHAGLRSYYGPSILAEFAENIEIFPYTKKAVEKTLFSGETIGMIDTPASWTSEMIPWIEENRMTRKSMNPYAPVKCVRGTAEAEGHLIGGCIEVLDMLKGTSVWDTEDFRGAILFLETSEDMPSPEYVRYSLRNLGAQGILSSISGLVFGTPYNNRFADEYIADIEKVLDEFGLSELPTLFGLPFGHTEPMTVLPTEQKQEYPVRCFADDSEAVS